MIGQYVSQFNSDVVRDLQKLDEKIDEERRSESYSHEKELKLKMAKLYRGMELTSSYNNKIYGGYRPF